MKTTTYEAKVEALIAEGIDRGDAQGIVDIEEREEEHLTELLDLNVETEPDESTRLGAILLIRDSGWDDDENYGFSDGSCDYRSPRDQVIAYLTAHGAKSGKGDWYSDFCSEVDGQEITDK